MQTSMKETFFWLSDSMISNECFLCNDPNVGLSLNETRSYVKCYMGDTGLLVSHAFDENELLEDEVYKQILAGKLQINEGMLYENEIAAANQEYNNSQMFHVMDEAEEHGEKIAEAAERNKPKTEEERKEEMVDEALGTEENKGMMSEIMDELSETTEEMTEQMTEKTVENMEELPDEVLQEQLVTDSLEAAEMVQTETIKRYVPIDIRV